MRATALLVAGLVAVSAFASEPGQPLDCSDWVFNEPGLSCAVWLPYSTAIETMYVLDERAVFDMARQLIRVRAVSVPPPAGCLYPNAMTQVEVFWDDGTSDGVIAFLPPRCDGELFEMADHFADAGIEFDPLGGSLFVSVENSHGCHDGTGWCGWEQKYWIAALHGFTTAFDVIQGYSPPTPLNSRASRGGAESIGFRVPRRPEGLPAADHFDTYYGALIHPIDFTQAQGLACAYPTTAPAVGDYLEVADTLSDPAPGTGRYYVTAATYQGQTRYGRKTTNRVMSGRDPAGLPGCGK